MLNYLCAEFYKLFHRKYTWIVLAVGLALETLLASGFLLINGRGGFEDFTTGVSTLLMLLPLGFYATLLTGDMVFAGQYKNFTLKNEVSFGLSRAQIYLGKLITQIVLSVLFCAVLIGFYLGLCWLGMYHDPERDAWIMRILGYCLTVMLPLWSGVQAVVCAMFFLIRSELGGAFAAMSVFTVLPGVFWLGANLAGVREVFGHAFMTAYDHMPTVMADNAYGMFGDRAFCGKAWIVGAIWFLVFTAIGLLGFHKKEIK